MNECFYGSTYKHRGILKFSFDCLAIKLIRLLQNLSRVENLNLRKNNKLSLNCNI